MEKPHVNKEFFLLIIIGASYLNLSARDLVTNVPIYCICVLKHGKAFTKKRETKPKDTVLPKIGITNHYGPLAPTPGTRT